MSDSSLQPAERFEEEGDYLIDWNHQYCSQLLFGMESTIRHLLGQVKSQLSKMKADVTFIEKNFDGPHENVKKLKDLDRELRTMLDPMNELADQARSAAYRATQNSNEE